MCTKRNVHQVVKVRVISIIDGSQRGHVGYTLGMGGTQNFVHGIYREKNTAVPGIPRYLFYDSIN